MKINTKKSIKYVFVTFLLMAQCINIGRMFLFVDKLLLSGCHTYACRPGYIKELTGRTFRSVEIVYITNDQWHAYIAGVGIEMVFTVIGMAVIAFLFPDYIGGRFKGKRPG